MPSIRRPVTPLWAGFSAEEVFDGLDDLVGAEGFAEGESGASVGALSFQVGLAHGDREEEGGMP
jgi:hypothetical protein